MKVAVVILNWNTRELLEKFLPLVIEHCSSVDGAEVIVADNASTDDSVSFLKEKFPEIRCIQLDKNYGFAGGYNEALAQVEAEYYLLLNSDIETTPNWLEPLLSVFAQDDSVAAVVPKIRSQIRKEYFEHAGAAGGYIDKYGFPFCAGRIFDEVEIDNGQYDASGPIFWGSGAALLVRADLWKQIQGLDADYFAHMEEIDLCWRLKNKGYSVHYCAESTVYHVGGGTLPETSPFKLYLNFRNNLFLLYKNLPKRAFRKTLLLRMLLDGVAASKFLIGGKFSSFASIFKAHLHFYKALPSLKKKRKLLEEERVVSEHPEMLQSSIVMLYFLKAVRRYTDIPR